LVGLRNIKDVGKLDLRRRPYCEIVTTDSIITIIIIMPVITFMQGIYNYIPETNHVAKVYSVPAVLYLQFVLQ
jgi:hypothetical protein